MGKIIGIALLFVVVAVGVIALLIKATAVRVQVKTSSHAMRRLADVPAEAWTRLNGKTIFFGHQSVGYNLLDGVRDLMARHPFVDLKLVETAEASRIEGPMLAHARVGRNRFPESKIAEFRDLMEKGLAEKVDIAFFKLCYIDMTKDSDPQATFAEYSKTMDSLKASFPGVTFVHVTVPLCGPRIKVKGITPTIKRLRNRGAIIEENRVRTRYNELLRERYSGKEPVFDLALYETLDPKGMAHCGAGNGVPLLVRAYTDDGGHLNTLGRQHVAEQLLIELAQIAARGQ